MTDLDALLCAVLANPADDLPRLVYADRLDELAGRVTCDWCGGSGEDRLPLPINSEDGKQWVYKGPLGPCPKCKGAAFFPDSLAERAEFIRLQCELAVHGWDESRRKSPAWACYCASVPPGHHCSVCLGKAKEWIALRRRERELFHAIDFPFLGNDKTFHGLRLSEEELEECQLPRKGLLRRGFVELVSMSAADWLTHADAIRAAHPVTEVKLTTVPQFGPFLSEDEYDNGRFMAAGQIVQIARDRIGEGPLPLLEARYPGIRFTLPPPVQFGPVSHLIEMTAATPIRAGEMVWVDQHGEAVSTPSPVQPPPRD